LREQLRVAEDNNGKIPKWLKCMTCREKTSFRPDEPKYHRLLIDLLGRAQKYAGTKIKQEAQEDANHNYQLKTMMPTKRSHRRKRSEDNLPAKLEELHMNARVRVKLEEEPEPVDQEPFESNKGNESAEPWFLSVDSENNLKVENEPEPIIEDPFERKCGNEFTDECTSEKSLEDGEINESSLNY